MIIYAIKKFQYESWSYKFSFIMGKRKTTILKQKYLRRKKLRETPRLPPEVAEALREKGVDVSATTSKQFYSKLGLQSDPNADVKQSLGFNDKLHQLRSKNKKPEQKPEGDAKIFEEVVESIPHSGGYKKKLNDYEIKCIAQLRAYYGDDLEMMMIDHKRNPMQWTLAQLKRYMNLYEEEAKELAEQVHQTEQEGNEEKQILCYLIKSIFIIIKVYFFDNISFKMNQKFQNKKYD